LLDRLPDYGLSEIQAKVYYRLLKLGKTSSIRVAKDIGIHRSETYRVLRELAQKGIVIEHSDSRPILYEPKPPEEAVNALLQERAKEFEGLKKDMPKLVDWLNARAKASKSPASVLLIDDDDTIRKNLSHALRTDGFNVDLAQDGQEALVRAHKRQHDVALIDIRLPDMDGMGLIKKLRTENPEIKQIIITGYPSIQNAAQAIDEKVNGYVTKPFNPSDLILKIREKLQA